MIQNRFERYPKFTLSITLISIFSLLLLTADRFLSLKNTRTMIPETERYIRLMEHKPLLVLRGVPTDSDLRGSEGLVKKEYMARIDEDGFIIPSKIHESPDVVIVFLGGSTTECGLMDENNRFPYLVGRNIEKETGLKINSYNGGKSRANSIHCINVLLNKVIPLKPNAVVLMTTINDLATLLHCKAYFNDSPTRSVLLSVKTEKPSIRNILRQIRDLTIPHVCAALKDIFSWNTQGTQADEFSRFRKKETVMDKPYILREFKTNLQTFIAICKVRDIIPILMTQENRFKSYPDRVVRGYFRGYLTYKAFKDIFDEMNQTIRDVGIENGAQVIDLAAKIPQEKKYMYDHVHFNDLGSRTAADIISNELKPIITSIKHAKDKTI